MICLPPQLINLPARSCQTHLPQPAARLLAALALFRLSAVVVTSVNFARRLARSLGLRPRSAPHLLRLFLFFLKLCGSLPCCDLLRFPELWSWLTGAFMHLVFPPLFPPGLLKSQIPPTNFEVCERVGVFFFLLYCKQRFRHLQRLRSRCFRRHVALFRLCFRLILSSMLCIWGWCSCVTPVLFSTNLPHLLFFSSGDERRTKTDKLTRACNLLVKAK